MTMMRYDEYGYNYKYKYETEVMSSDEWGVIFATSPSWLRKAEKLYSKVSWCCSHQQNVSRWHARRLYLHSLELYILHSIYLSCTHVTLIPVAEVLLYYSTGFIIMMYPTMKGTLYTQYLYQTVAIHTFFWTRRMPISIAVHPKRITKIVMP